MSKIQQQEHAQHKLKITFRLAVHCQEMGKRTLVRRRGRGGKQFRAIIVGKIAPAKYPNFKLEEHHYGKIIDIVHERGRDAPLAKIQFDDGRYSYVPAPEGTIVGNTIELGTGTAARGG